MRAYQILLALGIAISTQHARESGSPPIRTAPAATEASIPLPIPDGAPAAPPKPVEKPGFRIEGTQVRRVRVVEPAGMPGLPPVEGVITIRVHSVADPGLADPPPPLPPLPPDDPQVRERLAEMAANHRETRIAYIAATVCDRSRTWLTVYPGGGVRKTVTAWSNLDFHHFTGFGSFEARGADGEVRTYALLMGIGDGGAEFRRRLNAAGEAGFDGPVSVAFPDDTPSFVIVSENPDPEGITLIGDLHALYRAEGARMARACEERERAREERRAHLLAHPPKPKDVTVHFWKRQRPATRSRTEGGRP